MTPIRDSTSRVPNFIGREVMRQMSSAEWENPSFKAIDELGICFGSHPGARRPRNEDRVAVAKIANGYEEFTAALVCDGVGGSELGDAAATLAVSTFLEELAQIKRYVPVHELVVELIRKADEAIRQELKGSGTTTASVVLASSSGQIAAANVGDSRIYAWKRQRLLSQVSVDDTMENEFRDLPLNDPSVLDAHGLRGRLSQALGEVGRSSKDLRIVVFGGNDFDGGAILATDGAWKGSHSGFTAIALHAPSPSDVCRRILTLAGWAGGSDNVSVIVIDDLMRLARRDMSHNFLEGTRAVVWVSDTKIIMSAPAAFSQSSRSPWRESDPKRRKKKWSNRKETPHSQDERQSKAEGETKASERPKVEISTEEEPPALH